jgi:ABC-type phosphate/phosphonate transport system ATPase subunit
MDSEMTKPKLAIDHSPCWVYCRQENKVYWIVEEDDVEREFKGIAAFFDLDAAKEYLKKVHKMKDEKIVLLDLDNDEESG